MKITQHKLKSNGHYSIIKEPDLLSDPDGYVCVLNHATGEFGYYKTHKTPKGRYFKKNRRWYLSKFTQEYIYVPFQMHKVERE